MILMGLMHWCLIGQVIPRALKSTLMGNARRHGETFHLLPFLPKKQGTSAATVGPLGNGKHIAAGGHEKMRGNKLFQRKRNGIAERGTVHKIHGQRSLLVEEKTRKQIHMVEVGTEEKTYLVDVLATEPGPQQRRGHVTMKSRQFTMSTETIGGVPSPIGDLSAFASHLDAVQWVQSELRN